MCSTVTDCWNGPSLNLNHSDLLIFKLQAGQKWSFSNEACLHRSWIFQRKKTNLRQIALVLFRIGKGIASDPSVRYKRESVGWLPVCACSWPASGDFFRWLSFSLLCNVFLTVTDVMHVVKVQNYIYVIQAGAESASESWGELYKCFITLHCITSRADCDQPAQTRQWCGW